MNLGGKITKHKVNCNCPKIKFLQKPAPEVNEVSVSASFFSTFAG
jgi:hypothetical protein